MSETALIRKILKAQIKNQGNKFYTHEFERKTLYELIKQTVEFTESNSVLIIGSAGSGKNALLNNVLFDLEKSIKISNNSIVVKLNGLIHTDDKLSIKSLAEQLCVANDIDAQLSGNFAETLNFILNCFKSGHGQNKSVIIVLDEFELFCFHHKQTLLYNLFDVAQSGQTPICIIGLTCNASVVELLEKRVKSRFSHRKIQLNNKELHERVSTLLTLENNKELSKEIIKKWNGFVSNQILTSNCKHFVKLFCDLFDNQNELNNILMQFVCRLKDDHAWPDDSDLVQLLENSYKGNSKINLLSSLSILEISLMIAIKHQYDIYDGQPFNFKMIYERYLKFANSSAGIQAEPRNVIMKAYQHIALMEFIVLAANQIQSEHQMYKLAVTPKEISEAVKLYKDLPTALSQWAVSSFH